MGSQSRGFIQTRPIITTFAAYVQEPKNRVEYMSIMQLSSPAFPANDFLPAKYTGDDANLSPPLTISDVPPRTLSLVLIVDDPDAPAGDWVHWLVWNLSPQTTQISEGNLPLGAIQGLNDFGNQAYSGPCPPSGLHRYQFKLYALDTTLDLSSLTQKPQLLQAIKPHLLAETILIGLYQRR